MGSMRHRGGETVILHPFESDGFDGHGNPIEGFGPDVEREKCAVEPRVHEVENELGRSPVIHGFNVYDTFDSPVTDKDEITVRGIRCKVDGEIARWRNPFTGQVKGSVITLKRVDG